MREVTTFCYNDLVDFLYRRKLATEDEIHEFACLMDSDGGAFRPHRIAKTDEDRHKVEQILAEHFLDDSTEEFCVEPYTRIPGRVRTKVLGVPADIVPVYHLADILGRMKEVSKKDVDDLVAYVDSFGGVGRLFGIDTDMCRDSPALIHRLSNEFTSADEPLFFLDFSQFPTSSHLKETTT